MPTETPPRPDKNTYWVVPPKFLAGEYPGNEDPVKARKKIKQFLAAGIRHFVDLTKLGESGLLPYESILFEEARNSSIEVTYQRFPIRDNSVPRNAEHLAEILSAVDRRIKEEGAVYLHCWGGVGRTALRRLFWRSGETLNLLSTVLARVPGPHTPRQRPLMHAAISLGYCLVRWKGDPRKNC
jgi:hypothetical protein